MYPLANLFMNTSILSLFLTEDERIPPRAVSGQEEIFFYIPISPYLLLKPGTFPAEPIAEEELKGRKKFGHLKLSGEYR